MRRVICLCVLAAAFGRATPDEALENFLRRVAAEQLARRREAVGRLATPEQIRRRQEEIRATLRRFLGGLPEERTPLNLRRTGVLQRDGYRIEKIVYESLPRFYVTGNLYIPTTGTPPYPAVLQPVGHSQTAKARGLYQSLSIGLVRNGFVVLTYDPIGQGERIIFYDERLQTSLVGSSTREHQMVGIQSLLGGDSVARYRVWDGMRGIDVLESVSEADKERIGVAGCSGGGTLTAYIAALDARVKVAAPACYMSSWEEQLEGTGPQDAEQQFPGQLEAGINHGDFAIAFAPKPYLICSTTEDFFPIEGARRTFEESRRIYGALGAADKIAWFVGPGDHGMRRDTREAIYTWMARWLRGRAGTRISEPEHQIEYDEALYATATGQVATSLEGETASTLNLKRLTALRPQRPVRDVRAKAARMTGYAPVKRAPVVLERAKQAGEGLPLERIVYESEPGRTVPALLCAPKAPAAGGGAVLYLDAQGKEAGFGRGGDAGELCRAGRTVLAIDLAGNGETASKQSGYSGEWFGADKLTWLALMVGRPLVGLRVHDIVRGLDLLGDGPVAAVAKGTAGVSLLHAAVFDTRLNAVVLEDPLVSYRAIAETPIHRRIFDVVLPGVLSEYDLQDLAAAMAPRAVALVNVRSPMGALMQTQEVRRHYEHALAANAALRIGLRREGEGLLDACPELR